MIIFGLKFISVCHFCYKMVKTFDAANSMKNSCVYFKMHSNFNSKWNWFSTSTYMGMTAFDLFVFLLWHWSASLFMWVCDKWNKGKILIHFGTFRENKCPRVNEPRKKPWNGGAIFTSGIIQQSLQNIFNEIFVLLSKNIFENLV